VFGGVQADPLTHISSTETVQQASCGSVNWPSLAMDLFYRVWASSQQFERLNCIVVLYVLASGCQD